MVGSKDWRLDPCLKETTEKVNSQLIESAFVKQLEHIVLQTILLLQTKPELIEMGSAVGFGVSDGATNNFSKRNSFNGLLNPNWIGRKYKPPQAKTTPTGTHASPAMHWRKGFWRNQPVGQGRSLSAWRWIQPVLVNANSS